MGSYNDLVFTIPKEFHNWYGFARPRGFLRGTTMMPKGKLYWDFTAITKAQAMEVPHTHHALDEYIVLATADFNNFYDGFDAEIEIWLGEDPEHLEMHVVTEPVIVRIPPKLYHCPINFKRVDKPVLFSAIYPDGDWSKITRKVNDEGREEFQYDGAGIRRCVKDRSKECIYCGECFSKKMQDFEKAGKKDPPPHEEMIKPYREMAKLPRTGKYDKFVYPFKPEHHDDPNFLSPRTGFRGLEEMDASRIWYTQNIVQQECVIGEAHMHHSVEEYLFFTGSDIAKFFEFDAEVEIQLGEDPDHMESYTITEPTVVRVPAKFWHGPVTIKRLGSPINFLPFYPSGSYGRIVRESGAGSAAKYAYKGNDLPK